MKPTSRWIWFSVVVMTLCISQGSTLISFASEWVLRCHHCGQTCEQYRMVEKTIMVPTKVIESRVTNCLVQNIEEREEKYTAFVCKPYKRTFTRECRYLDDEVKHKEITLTEPKLVSVPVKRTKFVKVPETTIEEETVVRKVCTECGPVCIEETCPVAKTRLVDSTVVEDDCNTELIFEKTKKDFYYCVKVPKVHKVKCAEEDSFKLEPVEKTRKVSVCVPKFEKKVTEVEVTRMIPKKILVCEKCRVGH